MDYMNFTKSLKKFKIPALILSVVMILSFIAFIAPVLSCSSETDKTDNPDKIDKPDKTDKPKETADMDFYRPVLEDAIEQSRIYRNFLYDFENFEESEVSADLNGAIDNINKLLDKKSNSESDINNALNQFEKTAENFRVYYFDSENNNKAKDVELIDKLYIDGVKCAYDEKSKTFFYTMGQSKDRELKFDFYIESGMNLKSVFAELYNPGGKKTDYRFTPELNKEYSLKSYSDKIAYDYKIIFTVLPIIQIDNIGNIGDSYKDCTISVTDPDFSYENQYYDTSAHLFFETSAKIHIRGGISRGFPKKSYAVKFTNESGENRDMALFGMRSDSDWILDAMYIDRARARNRISTDIWNDYNSRLYFMKDSEKPQSNGTDGIFAEVFLRKEYIGLYCFTEKIDRKQLKLLKDDGKSYIYKGKSWEDPILFRGYWDYSNHSSYWGGFEQAYPNPGNGGKIEWKPLADLVDFGVNSSDKDFAENIEQYIDINNFIDYTIFLCISYAYDNTGKNCYWSVYDVTDPDMSKFFITPWDMDASWGRSWDSNKVAHDREWMDSASYEHDSYLFRRLIKTNAGGFEDKLKSRWEELKNNILSPENIVSRFDAAFDLFDASGAWKRESDKWRECDLNLESERKYIRDWTFKRWDYIDDFIRNKLDSLEVKRGR